MPTTKRDLAALHYLAQRLRAETYGAGTWHDNGLTTVLDRLEGHNLAITCERVLRHAADADARTPAAIERPFVPGPPVPEVARPPKPHEACRDCGQHVDRCTCDDGPVVRPLPRTPAGDHVARLRAIRDDATADHCSHGVDPQTCRDHRPTRTPHDTAPCAEEETHA